MDKVYLASIQLSDRDETLRQRLLESVPVFEDTIKELSGGEYRLALRSNDGSMFAWLMRSNHDARYIASQLYAPGTNRPPFDSRNAATAGSMMLDKFMVVEMGRDIATINNNMITTWVDRTFQSL